MGLYSSQMMAELQRRPRNVHDFTGSDVGQAMEQVGQWAADNPDVVLDVALVASGVGLYGKGVAMGLRGARAIRAGRTLTGIRTIERGYRRKLTGMVLTAWALRNRAKEAPRKLKGKVLRKIFT